MKALVCFRPDGLPDVTIEAEPKCGHDFCDRCGDCLVCDPSTHHLCPRGHRWVVYADIQPHRAVELLAAKVTA